MWFVAQFEVLKPLRALVAKDVALPAVLLSGFKQLKFQSLSMPSRHKDVALPDMP